MLNSLKTYLSLGTLIGLAILVLFARSHWIDVGASQVQALWDTQIAELAKAVTAEENKLFTKAKTEESQIRQQNERINQDEHTRAQALEADNIKLTAANHRLQLTLATQQRAQLNALPAPCANTTAQPPAHDPTPALRDVLAECSAEYGAVATEADRLASQVMGLQQYALMCSRRDKPKERGEQ